jgi:phage-related protein
MRIIAAVAAAFLCTGLSGCIVATAVGTAADVAGTAISTTADVAGSAVGAVTPDGDCDGKDC